MRIAFRPRYSLPLRQRTRSVAMRAKAVPLKKCSAAASHPMLEDLAGLERRMGQYETVLDLTIPPGSFFALYVDGHQFNKVTRDPRFGFQPPFDGRFHQYMMNTAFHIMTEGPCIPILTYTYSDAFVILFERDEKAGRRRTSFFLSQFASLATAKFSLSADLPVTFAARVAVLPQEENVLDYFRWQYEQCFQHALTRQCYWVLREEGKSARDAQRELSGLERKGLSAWLQNRDIVFAKFAPWKLRGVALYPKNGHPDAKRSTIRHHNDRGDFIINHNIPKGRAFLEFIQGFVEKAKLKRRAKRK